jgi:dihydropteroate synthase
MGILNVGHDSVADGRLLGDLHERVNAGIDLVRDGATIVDVGAISGRTDTPTISERREIDLVAPVVAELSGAGVAVSVDTWRPRVVEAVLEAGAALINDISGLADTAVARLAAQAGAGLVIMHTRAAPKQVLFPGYADPVQDVLERLRRGIDRACSEGLDIEQIVLDPGLDYSKTPQESIEVLRRLGELAALGRPLLLAVSRKYFIGMISGRPPERRLGGTLAAIAFGLRQGAHILRVHDVAEVAEFLLVAEALNGSGRVAMRGDPDDESLKWIAPKRPGQVGARCAEQ